MLKSNYAMYVGKNYTDGYVGYIAEGNFWVILSVEDGMTTEQGEKLNTSIKTALLHEPSVNLKEFELKLHDAIVKANIPALFSLAAGYLYKEVLFLKTVGEGEIYVRRGKEFAPIISGDKSASGFLRQFDCFVFTTDKINDLLGSVKDIKAFVKHNKPEDIVKDLEAEDYGEEDQGMVALFTEFVMPAEKKEPLTAAPPQLDHVGERKVETPPSFNRQRKFQLPLLAPLLSKISAFHSIQSSKQKTIVFVSVAIIFALLIWSVVLGSSRRAEAEMDKKVQTTKEAINQKLTQAEDSSFLNIERSMSLIAEAKTDVANLKKEVGSKKATEVGELDKLITDRENKIVKKEEKNFEEFYDLALENKDSQGSKMSADGENVAILDEKKGAVYVLSLTKKSLVKKSAAEVVDAQLVGLTKDDVYFVNQSKGGIYKFSSDDKVKKMIDSDKEWGDLTDLKTYGSNLYILDKDKSEIYKYAAIDKGFASRSAYLAGASSLSEANSIAIDSSVYISEGNTILKYTSGSADTFKTSFPDASVHIDKVFTNKDIEKVYAWDKSKGALYVMAKDGTYEKQIKSSALAKGSDFVVFGNAVYILSGQKIYKISL